MCCNFSLHPFIYLDATNRNWNKCWQCSKVILDFHHKWWSIITLSDDSMLFYGSYVEVNTAMCNAILLKWLVTHLMIWLNQYERTHSKQMRMSQEDACRVFLVFIRFPYAFTSCNCYLSSIQPLISVGCWKIDINII